ncbi:MAG: FAD-dependent oxidoreductase [Candidatus Aminicenantes bacterium]|nr:FAD-dependent oxidoreductase [Candidatus Aminicenantes bacterium]
MQKGVIDEEKPKAEREENIAVVGSGPGGLTCAHYLALEGYKVTVFESQPVAGGMLALGIPEFRLPKDILRYEIDRIKKLGVEIRTNTTIGKDISLDKLKEEYKAIFIAIGAGKGLKMKIPGEDTDGVLDAVEFLRDVNLGQEVKIGDKVIVVGGGNSAIDAARVAKRLGKDTRIFYRRTKAEMPAIKSEIEEAIAEGIDIQFLSVPIQVLSSNGKIEAVECIRMELGDIDASGRRRPVPIPESEFKVDVDTLILAISQEPDVSVLGGNGLKVSKWSTIEVDPENLHTNIEGVFAGGDVVTGPNTVTEAMAHGKIAAQMIDKYIRGEKLVRKYKVTRPAVHVEAVELSEREAQSLKKQEMSSAPVAQRIKDFNEVELGFTEAQAISEAKRCLRCDLEEKEEEVKIEEIVEEPVVEEKEEEKEEAAPEEIAVEEKAKEEEVKVKEAKEEVVEEKAEAVEEVAEEKRKEPVPEKIEEKVEEIKEEVEEKAEAVAEPKEKKVAAVIEIPEMKTEGEVKPAEVKKEEEKVEEKKEVTEEAKPEEKGEKKVQAVIEIPDMKKEEKTEEKKEEEKTEKAAEQKEEPKEKKIKAVIEIPEIKTEEKK